MGVIRHGLNKCFYCVKGGVPVPMPGAVRLDLNSAAKAVLSGTLNVPERLRSVKNIGYTGRLTVACLSPDFCRDVFGWDTSGGILTEKYTDGEPVEFRLYWQVRGTGERFMLHKCYALKPDITNETDENTPKFSTSAIPLYAYYDDSGNIKANTTVQTPRETYESWFERGY